MTPSNEYQKFTREAKAQLVSVFKYDREHDNTPESAVQLLVDAIGKDDAGEILAVMVMCKGTWDSRISRSSREWAEVYCSHDEHELSEIPGLYYCDEIHPAHMEQLVRAYRRLYPV